MLNAGQGNNSTRESSTGERTHQTQRDDESPASEPTIGSKPSMMNRILHTFSRASVDNNQTPNPQEEQLQDSYSAGTMGDNSITVQMHNEAERSKNDIAASRSGLVPRPIGGQEKLGMFSGVYVPTCLNVLSILMFLRFGFILGQSGILGMMG